MSMKTINVILYLPGYAGHFISMILSLDDAVYPWTSGKVTSEDRKDVYTFRELKDHTVPWITHHLGLYAPIPKFLESDYSTMFYCIHPDQYYSDLQETIESLPPTINYRFITVHGSEDIIKEHVYRFIERNGGFPFITDEGKQCFERFLAENESYRIDIDFLFSSEEDFIQGYQKLCEDFGVCPKIEDALQMYKDWREARAVNRVTEDTTKEAVLRKNVDTIIQWAVKNNAQGVLDRIYNKQKITGANGRS